MKLRLKNHKMLAILVTAIFSSAYFRVMVSQKNPLNWRMYLLLTQRQSRG